jgi:hypothetical protein
MSESIQLNDTKGLENRRTLTGGRIDGKKAVAFGRVRGS